MAFVKAAREVMLKRQLTQAELGDLCGVSLHSISSYLNLRRWPTPDVLERLCSALGVRFDGMCNLVIIVDWPDPEVV